MRTWLALGLLAGGAWAVSGCSKGAAGGSDFADQPKPDISRQNAGRPDPSGASPGTTPAPNKRAKGAD